MSARREHDPDPHNPRSTRNSGIDSIGNIAWGTHFCQFYQTDQDLIDILVPYLKAGLGGNEFCMWITSRPLEVEQATAALRRGVPELDRYLRQGQIEILDYSRWYTPSGTFRAEEVLQAWVDKLDRALEGGFEGLRLTGNTFWLQQADWRRFTDYEEAINNMIGRYRMIALCTYSLDRCSPLEIIDVVKNHQFALIKNAGNWEIIESGEHRKMEKALTESEQRYRSLVNLCPDAILVHAENRYVFANPAAASLFGASTPGELIGRDVLDLIHPRDRGTVADRIRQAQAGTVIPLREVSVLRLDGTPVDVEVTGTRIVFEGTPAIQIVARDITERKKGEEALRLRTQELEQANRLLEAARSDATTEKVRLEAVMEALPVGLALMDAEGEFIRFNHTYDALLGQPRTNPVGVADYAAYNSWWPETGKKVRPEEWAGAQAVLHGRTVLNQVIEIQRFDGKRSTILNSGVPIRDSAGRITGSAVVVWDITERQRAQEELRRRAEEIQAVMNVVPAAIWVSHDPQCLNISGNKRANEFYEAADGENVSAEITAVRRFFKEGRELAAAELPMQQAAATGCDVRDEEMEVVLPSGRRIAIWGNASPLRDSNGRVRGCIGAFMETTERKAAERARERLVEQQGGLLAASEAILTQRDPAVVLQLAADAARQLTGAKLCVSGHGFRDSRFQLGGFSRSDDIPVPPAGQHFRMERGGVYMDLLDRVPSLRLTDSQLRSHPRWWGVPKEHVPLNGLMGTRLLARDSKPSGMILVSHKSYGDFDEQDETALNQLGAIVSLALQHLEASAEAEARASEALARGDELARSNQELEQFAYVASHDLQEPLRMVTGFVGLLRDRYYDKLDDKANQYIGYAVDGANRMSQLIQDLLTYSRTGSTGRPPAPVRCAEAMDAALANLHRSLIEQRVIVKVGDLPSVIADAIQLTQLFQNLIGNAIKFCRDGVRPEIQIGARPEEGKWVIWVSDNGIGIPSDQYERIFKVFQRLHTWQKYPGTGIGLAICKKIVELHGGQIWLESRLGEGSTFYFTFPCA
jgi:PAS domain S-box-containing protein